MAAHDRRFIRFAVSSALGVGVVLGLVWAMVFRESQARKLYLQFEAYRASTVLLEAYRENASASLIGGPVLGFGIYDGEGTALLVQGSAPSSLTLPPGLPLEFQPGSKGRSTLLIRTLRAELQGLRGMMGQPMMDLGQGMMRGYRNRFQNLPPELPPGGPNPGPFRQMARTLWLEYGSSGLVRERAFLFGGAALLSFALCLLYLLLLNLYRKNAELQARETASRELIQLGEAARTLVHEVKNPLGIIRVQAGFLKRSAAESPTVLRAAGVIEDEVLRLAELADRLREFLKAGKGRAEAIELAPFLERFAGRYAPAGAGADGNPGQLHLILPESLNGRVFADPELLARALDNLLRNGWEAAPAGVVELSVENQGKFVEFSVSDRGGGVPPELEERLFEPFFTTKEGGSGIGLALARRIAEGAGGKLRYRKRPGGGASFILTLPWLEAEA